MGAFVIAVSGWSGAGKTRVVERTAELLGDAARLHFDAYRSVSRYPEDGLDWLARGAPLEEWKTPLFARDLGRLRAGEAVELPAGGGVVEPADYVVIEEPFARLHEEMSALIDLAAYLDVPSDVLLARRLRRRLSELGDARAEEVRERLRQDLDDFLAAGRRLEAHAREIVPPSADLVLDGLETVDEIARRLVAEARRRRGAG